MFRTLSRFTSEAEIKEYHLELSDRFGKLPAEVENLLTLTMIKIYAAKAHFTSITVMENRVLLRKRAADTFRVNGKIPHLDGNAPAEVRLKDLLRIVRLAGLEK